MEKIITCLMGPSLSGKSTITNILLQEHDLVISKHTTTRKPRIDDQKDFYNYISLNEFTDLLNKGKLIIGSSDGIRGYGVTYSDCTKAFKKNNTILIHASYKDIKQLKKIKIPVRLVVLTYRNLKESMLQRSIIENKSRNDMEYRLSSAIEDQKKYFDEIKDFAQKVIYTDEETKEKTYENTSKAFGYIPYTRKRVK